VTPLLLLVLAAAPPSALERTGAAVVAVALERHFPTPIAMYVEGAPAPLQRALASVLAARLSDASLPTMVVDAHDAAEAERLARERGATSLIRLTASIDGTRLLVRGDLIAWRSDAGLRVSPVAIIAHAADVDAEVLLLATGGPSTPAPPLELKVVSLAKLSDPPAALALIDLDGDRKAEVVVVVGDHLEVHAPDGRLLARAEFQGLPSTHPSRDAFGAVSAAGNKLVAWSGRRDRAELFAYARGALKSLGPTDAVAYESLVVKLEAGPNVFKGELTWAGKPFVLPAPPQAIAQFGAVGFFAFADGTAAVARGVVPTTHVGGVGTGSTLGDLDADGTPEVIVTSAKTVGEVDEVKVLTLSAFETLQSRNAPSAEASAVWQAPLKGRAVVAASGDLDGDGVDEVVFGLWFSEGPSELVVLRRAAP
jgi:hypothetical protein